MKPIFKICKYTDCSIQITGLEAEALEYVNYFSNFYGEFRYEDVVSINILIKINSDGSDYIVKYLVDEHKKEVDQNVIEFPKDGLYKIMRIIVPTKEWKDNYSGNVYDTIYYYDNNSFYKNDGEEVEIFELVEVNEETASLFKSEQHTFCLCKLLECFYKFAREYFKKLCSNKCLKSEIDNRDILWIGINTIKYLLELGRYYEAQSILESLTGCTGLCKEINKSNSDHYDCGCSY